MGRKCSHCGNIGHNSRTCTTSSTMTTFVNSNNNNANSSLRLFGVKVDIVSSSPSSLTSSSSSSSCSNSNININVLKKSFSMDCLMHSSLSSPSSSPSSSSSAIIALDETNISDHHKAATSIGYLSDGLIIGRPQERKKGVPWTEEEHRTFLIGLEKLGKGDWRGISRSFVTTRTPTQVASHAQKYFLRQATLDKKKRRSSLFDMVGCSPPQHTSSDNQHNKDIKTQQNGVVLPLQLELSTSLSDYNNHHHDQKPGGVVDFTQLASSHHHHHHHHHGLPLPPNNKNNNSVPVWIHGLMDSQLKSSSSNSNSKANSTTCSNTGAGVDLELNLGGGPARPAAAAAASLEQNNNNKSSNPCPGLLFVGPITVT
ncbi:transcription factor MYB1R1 [Cannabis sativa]|uniref:transcription factor MYB1R1 n=1 Tax=Cannabis sativa TaxID=3483 RepID=UPI0029C9E255|nr:transcription factor MYB1R1 [Cannabis sativa]